MKKTEIELSSKRNDRFHWKLGSRCSVALHQAKNRASNTSVSLVILEAQNRASNTSVSLNILAWPLHQAKNRASNTGRYTEQKMSIEHLRILAWSCKRLKSKHPTFLRHYVFWLSQYIRPTIEYWTLPCHCVLWLGRYTKRKIEHRRLPCHSIFWCGQPHQKYDIYIYTYL